MCVHHASVLYMCALATILAHVGSDQGRWQCVVLLLVVVCCAVLLE
jgi:hypothetical protein